VVLVQQVFKKIFIFVLYILFSVNCFANDDSTVKVETYLNSIKYMKANFVQDDKTNSQLAEGILYISRPGKLRLDYTNPFQASLYASNKLTTYYDKELDEITNIATSSTPLHFLLKEKISFNDKYVHLLNFEETKENIEVTLKEIDKEDQGTLVLKFTKNPIELKSMTLINSIDQETEIILFNVSKETIQKKIFDFQNPRLKRKM
jgi:outer membrane lipoprotein-sorting protein